MIIISQIYNFLKKNATKLVIIFTIVLLLCIRDLGDRVSKKLDLSKTKCNTENQIKYLRFEMQIISLSSLSINKSDLNFCYFKSIICIILKRNTAFYFKWEHFLSIFWKKSILQSQYKTRKILFRLVRNPRFLTSLGKDDIFEHRWL